jgi:hypothetical protein
LLRPSSLCLLGLDEFEEFDLSPTHEDTRVSPDRITVLVLGELSGIWIDLHGVDEVEILLLWIIPAR